MNTKVNKFVATFVALALCFALAIIVAPLSHADDTSSVTPDSHDVIPDSDLGSSSDVTDGWIPNQVWNDNGDVQNGNEDAQNDPVDLPDGSQGLPDGSQGGGITDDDSAPAQDRATRHHAASEANSQDPTNDKATPDDIFPSLRGAVGTVTTQSVEVQPLALADCADTNNNDTTIDLSNAPSGECETANWEYLYDGSTNYYYIITNSTAVTITGSESAPLQVFVADNITANITLDNASFSVLCMSGPNSNSNLNLTLVNTNTVYGIAFDTVNISGNGSLELQQLNIEDGNLHIANNASLKLTSYIAICLSGTTTCTGDITIDSGATFEIGSTFTGGSIHNITNNGTFIVENDIYYSGIYSENGSKSGSGSVTPATEITSDDITLSVTSLEYNGSSQGPTVVVVVNTVTLRDGYDFFIDCVTDCTNVGTATISVIGIGQYAGIVEKTFTITPKELTLDAGSINARPTYDGKQHLLNVDDYTYALDGIENLDDVSVNTAQTFFMYYDSDYFAYTKELTNVTSAREVYLMPTLPDLQKYCDPVSAEFAVTSCEDEDYDLLFNTNPDISSMLLTGAQKDNYYIDYHGLTDNKQGDFEVQPALIVVLADDVEISQGATTLPANSTLTYTVDGLVPGDTLADNVLSGGLQINTSGGCSALATLSSAPVGVYNNCVVSDGTFTFSDNYQYVYFYSGTVRVMSADDESARSLLTDPATGITVRCNDGAWICTSLPLGTRLVVNPKHDPTDPDHAALLAEIEADDSAAGYGADLAWKFNRLYDIHLVDSTGALYPAAGTDLSGTGYVQVRIPQTIDEERAAPHFEYVHKHEGSAVSYEAQYGNNREISFDVTDFSLFGVAFVAAPSGSGSIPGGVPDEGLPGAVDGGGLTDGLDAATAGSLAQTGTSLNIALLALFMLLCAAGAVRRRQMRH